ncbi:carboxypeptidase M32 [Crenobacter sp. SG2303]|uniref:Metal-dependent carboxypeptidase n=1 Tax=Crenobacter oryzisoli TaxID=3056844 RepID=A0ABT7XJL3_9NEIS|nr:carboxypeptidase M32 [Crenobacter sp. SG2303]MDN0073982.1 carboxypeptidase M32 [Crenobacter sp. SG2303]
MPHTPAFQELTGRFQRLYRFEHLQAIAGWDQATMMPAKGNDARAAALAELSLLIHGQLTDPALGETIHRAEDEALDDEQRADLREMRRQWEAANLLPEALVEAKSLAGARCEHAWRSQRPANDWAGFLENFREVVRLSREEAKLRADALGVSPYDALIYQYEPGMNSAEIERIFGEVKTWLPGLIAQVRAKQANEAVIAPVGPFAIDKQRALGLEVMARLGFDFDGGRLDVSAHPFSGGTPEDSRITTRYNEADFTQSLMGIVHETGHARYEQNLPRHWLGQPIGLARSMGVHESQSLSFEMQLGRHPGFLAQVAPLIRAQFGEQPAFEPDNLARLYTRVEPGYIRVDADELTYPAHVILRFEIERALIDGEIEAEDIPALWDEKMQAYLGVDTRGNYRDGCLQDIHWTDGSFGYFPSYTLGAMYAAQYFATLRRQQPDVDARIAAGDYAPVFDWLNANIWSQASRWETPELIRRATGEALNPVHFRAHLEARYLG